MTGLLLSFPLGRSANFQSAVGENKGVIPSFKLTHVLSSIPRQLAGFRDSRLQCPAKARLTPPLLPGTAVPGRPGVC